MANTANTHWAAVNHNYSHPASSQQVYYHNPLASHDADQSLASTHFFRPAAVQDHPHFPHHAVLIPKLPNSKELEGRPFPDPPLIDLEVSKEELYELWHIRHITPMVLAWALGGSIGRRAVMERIRRMRGYSKIHAVYAQLVGGKEVKKDAKETKKGDFTIPDVTNLYGVLLAGFDCIYHGPSLQPSVIPSAPVCATPAPPDAPVALTEDASEEPTNTVQEWVVETGRNPSPRMHISKSDSSLPKVLKAWDNENLQIYVPATPKRAREEEDGDGTSLAKKPKFHEIYYACNSDSLPSHHDAVSFPQSPPNFISPVGTPQWLALNRFSVPQAPEHVFHDPNFGRYEKGPFGSYQYSENNQQIPGHFHQANFGNYETGSFGSYSENNEHIPAVFDQPNIGVYETGSFGSYNRSNQQIPGVYQESAYQKGSSAYYPTPGVDYSIDLSLIDPLLIAEFGEPGIPTQVTTTSNLGSRPDLNWHEETDC